MIQDVILVLDHTNADGVNYVERYQENAALQPLIGANRVGFKRGRLQCSVTGLWYAFAYTNLTISERAGGKAVILDDLMRGSFSVATSETHLEMYVSAVAMGLPIPELNILTGAIIRTDDISGEYARLNLTYIEPELI